ncbi:MAG TPA: 2-dehydropantoate 2-reductase [Geminicoccaceae bacterium]|nr:2-dehydropantoate 2-reductase [Geminicoccaceae bacterium]
MKIAVLGAGGVGGYFGARLAADDNEVIFVARGVHAEAMRQDGLRVLSPTDDLHLRPVTLHEDLLRTGLVDAVLVAVKMYDLEEAAATVRPLLHFDTAVVPFQNGVEAGAILERALGRRHVCGGVAYVAAAIEAPGVVRHAGGGRLLFGERDGRTTWRLEMLQAACQGAGIDAALTADIELETWRKFLFLAPFAAITCLGRTTIGAVREDPMLWPRFMAMVEEAAAVARARGVALPGDAAGERIAFARGLPTDMRSSMLHDLEAGRRLELDWLTGAVVRLGAEAGVATPASEEAYRALAPSRHGLAAAG